MPPPGHQFTAEYRSQQSPGWSPSTVRFDVRGLVIERRDIGRPTIWPYASLGTNAAVPIANTTRVVLTSGAISMRRCPSTRPNSSRRSCKRRRISRSPRRAAQAGCRWCWRHSLCLPSSAG